MQSGETNGPEFSKDGDPREGEQSPKAPDRGQISLLEVQTVMSEVFHSVVRNIIKKTQSDTAASTFREVDSSVTSSKSKKSIVKRLPLPIGGRHCRHNRKAQESLSLQNFPALVLPSIHAPWLRP